MSWRGVAGGLLIAAGAIGCEGGALPGTQSGAGRAGSGAAMTGSAGVIGAAGSGGLGGRACPCSRRPGENESSMCPAGTGKVTTVEIGPEGGTVLLDGTPQTRGVAFKLEIPSNVLAEVVTIQVTESTTPPPEPWVDQSPIYDLQPAGLTFASRARITIPFQNVEGIVPRDTAAYLSTPDLPSFTRLADSYINAGFVTASVPQLGQVLVGRSRTVDDELACGRGPGTE
jgi:hypothetical protein